MTMTLRARAGLVPPAVLDTAITALILVDIQMDYFTPGQLLIPDGERVLVQSGILRDWAAANGIAVVHIQQTSSPASPLFASGTPGCAIHPRLTPRPGETVIQKTLPCSFCGTGLHAWLQAHGISTIILAGLMTHMCVETTARGALPLGYAVIVAADACASRDLPLYNGQMIHYQEVHRNALAAMGDRFADVMTVEQIRALSCLPQR